MLITKDQFSKESEKYEDWNIWQSYQWWEFQSNIWKEVYSLMDANYLALAIKQWLPFDNSYIQVPKWPLWITDNCFFDDLIELAKKQKSIFIRIISESPLICPEMHFQVKRDQFPRSTLIIDLTQGEDEILMQMKQKGRYNIRVAQKNWIIIKEEEDSIKWSQVFFDLMEDTSSRDGFSWYDDEYYRIMIDSLWKKAKVLIAYFENEPVAAWIFTFSDNKAIYYYWASSNKHRNLMAPYLIQWKAISVAKQMKCKTYDFLWIASDIKNKKDPLYWVSQFKMKFWWEIVTYPQAIDIPVCLWKYALYRLVNILRWRG